MIARTLGRPATNAVAVLATLLLCAPAAALAASDGSPGTGGGGLGGGSGSGTTTIPSASPSVPVSAVGDGITLSTTSSAVMRSHLVFSGTAGSAAGQDLEVERRGTGPGATWQPVLRTPVHGDGSFRAVWHVNALGRFSVRALVVPNSGGPTASASAADPTLTVTVYPTSKATIYGPGFYGQRTACGGRLTRATIGVANRTLPCGTKVSILYDGRTLTVPVIDRGPYANDADWDLTTATAQALGIAGTEWIGTLTVTHPDSASAIARRGRRRR